MMRADVFPALLPEPFDVLLHAAATSGPRCWEHLSHIYALSAALQLSLKSYCPPYLNMRLVPLTKNVYSRGVST